MAKLSALKTGGFSEEPLSELSVRFSQGETLGYPEPFGPNCLLFIVS